MEATTQPSEKLYFQCDPLGGRFSIDQCRANRKRPGDSMPIRIHCTDCALARALDAGKVATFTLEEMLGGHRPAPPPVPERAARRPHVPRRKPVVKSAPTPAHPTPKPERVARGIPAPKRKPVAKAPDPSLKPRTNQAPPPEAAPAPEYANYALPEAPIVEFPLEDFERRTRFLLKARHWTPDEIELLRREYPTCDLDELCRKLGRKAGSIHTKASHLQIRRTVYARKKRRKYELTPQIEAAIRKVYGTGRRYTGDVDGLASRIGWPRYAVSRKATELGIVPMRIKEPNWCDRELKILERNAYRSPDFIKKKLKRAGFERTVLGIVLKRKRMRLTSPNLDGYSANRLAMAFGIDPHSITTWIRKGWLKAEMRGTSRMESQGGDGYWIKPKWVRTFIVEHVEMIDLAKVDRTWFVDILARRGP